MNKRRLLKLADLLEADAKNKKGIKFDMYGWGRVSDPDAPLSCGTAACAMGLAALSGAFERAGLTADYPYGRVGFRWRGRRVDGFSAGAKLFDIAHWQSEQLFALNSDNNLGAVAERAKAKQIRKFVATGEL